MATTASETKVQELYIAYFGRPADPAGLAFYADALDAASTTVEAIATSFAASTEAATIVALDTDAYLSAVYLQAFGRAYVEGTDGTFWKDAINNAATTKELAMVQILEGASGTDTTAVANKVTVAKTYTAAVTADSKDYSSTADAAAAKAVLDAVTEDAATVTSGNTAAQTAVDSLSSTTSNPGGAFALTTDADDIIAGTTGDDVITSDTVTYNAGDIIIDTTSTDNDTLNLTYKAADITASPTVTVAGIENINVDLDVFTGGDFDATNVTGATITASSSKLGYNGLFTAISQGANNVVAGSNVTALTSTLITTGTVDAGSAATVVIDSAVATATVTDRTLAVTANGDLDVSATFDANAATDTQTLALTSTVASTVTLSTLDNETGTITDENQTTVTFDSNTTLVADAADVTGMTLVGDNYTAEAAGGATLAVGDFTVGTITVADAALAITEVGAAQAISLTVADAATSVTGASATTSNATVAISANQSAGSLALSALATSAVSLTSAVTAINDLDYSGATTVNVAGNVALSDSDENATTDTLVITGSGDVTLAGVISSANTAALTGDLTFSNDTSIDLSLTAGSGDDTITLANTTTIAAVNTGNGTNTIDATALTTGTLAVTGGTGVDTVSIDSSIGAATLALAGGAGTDIIEFVGAAVDTSTVVTWANSGFESLVYRDAGGDAVTVKTSTVLGSHLAGLTSLSIGAASATDAEADDTLTLTVTADVATVDLSGLVVANTTDIALTINGSATNTSITGTNANDTIATLSTGDTVSSGAGDDSVTLVADINATLDGGTGTDTLVMEASDFSDNTAFSFTGFETLDLTDGAAEISYAQYNSQTFAVTDDRLTISVNDLTVAATLDTSNVTLGAGGSLTVTAGNLNDTITTGDIVTTINAGTGDDTVTAGGDNDIINGGTGADTINGGSGADTITGGTGADILVGGIGADIYVYSTTGETASATNWTDTAGGSTVDVSAADIITGAAGDVISLAALDAGGAFVAVNETATQVTDGSALGATTDVSYYTGNYSNGTFTSAADASASDILVVWDNDAAGGSTSYEMIVVTGISDIGDQGTIANALFLAA